MSFHCKSVFILRISKHSNPIVSSGTDSEIQMLKDVPLYNDVMLPATSDELALPLSPLPPSEPLCDTTATSVDAKTENYAPAQSTKPTTHCSSDVRLTEILHSYVNVHSPLNHMFFGRN